MQTNTNTPNPLAKAIAADRKWFEHHPHATVRFRREAYGEFSDIINQGHTIPTFIPSSFKPESPLNAVAVVDLTRLIDGHKSQSRERVRVRIRTVTIRSKKHRENLAQELQRAVAEELIMLITGISSGETSHKAAAVDIEELAS